MSTPAKSKELMNVNPDPSRTEMENSPHTVKILYPRKSTTANSANYSSASGPPPKKSRMSTTFKVFKHLRKKIFPHHHRLHARYASPAQVKMNACKSFFEGLLVTRELAPRGDRELYIRYTVREIAVYSVYLFIITMMTIGLGSGTPFLFTETMTNLFVDQPLGNDNPKTLQTAASVEDFWIYMRDVIPIVMYSEFIYDEKWPVNRLDNPETFGILYENQLMGLPRLRQLRVKSDSCPVADNFRHLTRECFPPYLEELEDTGRSEDRNSWEGSGGKFRSAWQYQTAKQLHSYSYTAELTTYSGAGAIQVLTKRLKTTMEIIQNLHRNEWVNRATRVVFFDFTVYNANVNLFCIVRIVFEFPATGGLTTSWSFRTLRLIEYLTWFEKYVVFPSEILFCVFTLYYLIQEILEFKSLPFREYIRDIYTWLDIIILVFSCISIGFSIYQAIQLAKNLKVLTNELNEFHDFENLGYWQTHLNYARALCVFFAWIKVFKYISFNKTMIQLYATLARCSQDIGGFAVMFFIVFFAFAQLGYVLFGSQVQDFRTFDDSVFTLLRLIVGEFNFRRIEAANRVLGPIFFLAYVFFIFFVLLNMFLAIMTDTYSEVKAEIQAQRNEFEISDYINRSFNNFVGLFGRRNVHSDAEDAVKLAPADGQLTYEEISKSLKRANFTDIEIKLFLGRFGLHAEGSLDEEDSQLILDSFGLEPDKANQGISGIGMGLGHSRKPDPNSIHLELKEQFSGMQARVVNLEVGLTALIHKIVNLTERLQE